MIDESQVPESENRGNADPDPPNWSPNPFQSPERDELVRRARALVPRINEMIRNRPGGIENAYPEDEDWSEDPADRQTPMTSG